MTPYAWRILTTVFLGLSFAVLALTLILPSVKLPQAVSYVGPTTPYQGASTDLSGYFLPPINRGDPIKIGISNFTQNSILVILIPASPGNLAPLGPRLLQEIATGPNFTSTSISPETQSYGLYVVSYNGTSFDLMIESSWSPFYVLNTYTVPAVFLVLVSAAAAYYYTHAEKRWRVEQEAIKDATARRVLN